MRTDHPKRQFVPSFGPISRRELTDRVEILLWQARWTGSLFVISLLVALPYFAAGDPPGVDAPTFLHFSWVFEQWVSGNGDSFLNDPWWYNGLPYLQAYSPGGYGAAGLLAAVMPFSLSAAFKLVMFGGLVGTVMTTYWLARTLGLRQPYAFAGALLALFSYPVLAGVGIYGWLPTLASMPLAMAAYVLVERWTQNGERRDMLIAGALLGLSLVAHHMTAIAFGMAIVVRLAVLVIDTPDRRGSLVRPLLAMSGAFLVASMWWAIPFLVNTISVGFERELAGNWQFALSVFTTNVFDRGLIGIETYPSYIGIVQGALGIGAAIYAIIYRTRFLGLAIVAAVLFWFSMGASGNPLIRIYPLSGLDVSRFAFYVAPLLAVLAASALQQFAGSQYAARSQLVMPVIIAAIMVLPVVDAVAAQDTLDPVEEPAHVTEAIDWVAENVPADSKVLAVGYRNWDGYWLPARAGVPIMDGWYDEGAANWRNVRDYRLMGWLQDVDIERLHEIMAVEGVDYLVITIWDTTDNPELFRDAAPDRPDLFELQAELDGTTIYRRL